MSNLKQVMEEIKKRTQKALYERASKDIKKVIVEHAQTDVYDAYTPTSYERTYDMLDEEKIEVEQYGECGIQLTPNVIQDGKDIVEVVSTGIGYDYHSIEPRPYVKNAQEELNNGLGKEILKKALREQGVDIK